MKTIIIAQSNIVDHDQYNLLDINHLELFKTSVYPRMVRYKGKFMSHLDYINKKETGLTYREMSPKKRRKVLNVWNLPSMAGIHLLNYLKVEGIKATLINNIDSELDILEEICKDQEEKLFIVSTTFYLQWKEVKRIKQIIRQYTEDKIVIGGAFVNAQYNDHGIAKIIQNIKNQGIDAALFAFNSEQDLLNLIKYYQDNSKLLPNNCCIKLNDEYISTKEEWNKPLVNEIEPIWHELDIPSFEKTLQIRTASGCPFSCAFCSYPTTAKVWETSDAKRVRQHLESLCMIKGLEDIVFIDDTFNVPVDRFKKLIKIFKDYNFGWYSFLRVQFLDEEIVKDMKESGCKGVYLGIESASDKILKNMNKQARVKDFKKGVNLLNKYDIDYVAAFVLGFPGETEETIMDNINFIEENKVKYYALKEFYYMENTKVHKERESYALTGMGAKWKHATMNYNEATEYKLKMFMTIKNSQHVDPDTSLWHLVHMHDMGYTKDDIINYQREINGLILEDLENLTETKPLRIKLKEKTI